MGTLQRRSSALVKGAGRETGRLGYPSRCIELLLCLLYFFLPDPVAGAAGGVGNSSRTVLPETRSWQVSAGPSYLSVDLPELGVRRGHSGGVMLAGSTFLTPALSLTLDLFATPGVWVSVSRRDLLVAKDRLRGQLHIAGRTALLVGGFHPLRVGVGDSAGARFQPYLLGGVGVAVLPLELRGSYTSPAGSAEVRLDVTEAVGLWLAGIGADFRSSSRLGVFVEGNVLSSFAEPRVRTVIDPGGTVQEGTLSMRAVGFRVGLRCLF